MARLFPTDSSISIAEGAWTIDDEVLSFSLVVTEPSHTGMVDGTISTLPRYSFPVVETRDLGVKGCIPLDLAWSNPSD